MELIEPQNGLDLLHSDLSNVVSNDVSDTSREPSRRLRLVNTVQLPPVEDSEAVNVDVIHVTGVDRERQLGLDNILGNTETSRRREFIFQCDISSLLLGDLVLDAVHSQTVQLLDEIVSFNDANDGDNKIVQPARIFVAYDFGALIVNNVRYPGLLANSTPTSHTNAHILGHRYCVVERAAVARNLLQHCAIYILPVLPAEAEFPRIRH
ncbi:hypothetical protein BDW66DRAFT_70878 [Aspergillus desertorum]